VFQHATDVEERYEAQIRALKQQLRDTAAGYQAQVLPSAPHLRSAR
jgi:hypothetical protein